MRRRIHVPFAQAATLTPGTVFRGRVIESIHVDSVDAIIVLVGPKLSAALDKSPSYAELDPRFRSRPWRP